MVKGHGFGAGHYYDQRYFRLSFLRFLHKTMDDDEFIFTAKGWLFDYLNATAGKFEDLQTMSTKFSSCFVEFIQLFS